MARSATIHRANVVLSHIDRGVHESFRVTLARHPSETAERLVVRLLAYTIRYGEGIAFGRGISTQDEPDVWRHSDDGRLLEWIEVGLPSAERVLLGARRAESAYVFVHGNGVERWKEAALARLATSKNISACSLPDEFVHDLAQELPRSFDWTLTLTEGVIYLDCEGRSLVVSPDILLGTPMS
jgi:uncharacterized protein YaeQ